MRYRGFESRPLRLYLLGFESLFFQNLRPSPPYLSWVRIPVLPEPSTLSALPFLGSNPCSSRTFGSLRLNRSLRAFVRRRGNLVHNPLGLSFFPSCSASIRHCNATFRKNVEDLEPKGRGKYHPAEGSDRKRPERERERDETKSMGTLPAPLTHSQFVCVDTGMKNPCFRNHTSACCIYFLPMPGFCIVGITPIT